MEMLEAGVHFGHKKERSHPRAKDFIFTLREGVYVIDLDKTQEDLQIALEFLRKQVTLGKNILFVGTKRQAKEITQRVAEKTGMPYITKHFLGGTLTNFETIRKNIIQMEELEAKILTPEYAALTKKEKKIINDKREKLLSVFGGVRGMKNLPDALFIIDGNKEKLAVTEANRMGIPVVAIIDTDANPDTINYPIPANDDASKSLTLLMDVVEKEMVKASGAGDKAAVVEEKAEVKAEIVEENKTVEKSDKKTTKTKSTKKPARVAGEEK